MIRSMAQVKLSVSISDALARFLEGFRETYGVPTKSEVVERALRLLQEAELEKLYNSGSPDADHEWEATTHDGLEAEDWS